ncbi:hypothetical protein cyc_02154 [Cyclospora cayetanensis]|uniref:Uncharacterized protein n=1 Tax=Cyclospora cayetanensis TaxID=88456 RepID=A0A1D3D9U2_9EIME|nr:hypothetical protein cyc_02154 [Cyclospora cayetanensis]
METAALGTEGVLSSYVEHSAPHESDIDGGPKAEKRKANEAEHLPDLKRVKQDHSTSLSFPEPLSKSMDSLIDSFLTAEQDGIFAEDWLNRTWGGALDDNAPEDVLWEALDGLQTSPPGSSSLLSEPSISHAVSPLSAKDEFFSGTVDFASSPAKYSRSSFPPPPLLSPNVVYSVIGKQAEGVKKHINSIEQAVRPL